MEMIPLFCWCIKMQTGTLISGGPVLLNSCWVPIINYKVFGWNMLKLWNKSRKEICNFPKSLDGYDWYDMSHHEISKIFPFLIPMALETARACHSGESKGCQAGLPWKSKKCLWVRTISSQIMVIGYWWDIDGIWMTWIYMNITNNSAEHELLWDYGNYELLSSHKVST